MAPRKLPNAYDYKPSSLANGKLNCGASTSLLISYKLYCESQYPKGEFKYCNIHSLLMAPMFQVSALATISGTVCVLLAVFSGSVLLYLAVISLGNGFINITLKPL